MDIKKKVKLLPSNIIKLIAAGEVIESPAAVVKELVENSIDALATSIEISIRNGGKSFISVLDNGEGILKDDLKSTVLKHTTSKLDDCDLFNIRTMGFRGEALFSIAYMSKLIIKSKAKNCNEAYEVSAENNYVSNVKLSNFQQQGTYVEVRDLFFSFPARLKFLKSDTNEASDIYKIVDSIAMAHPHIGFKVFNNGRKIIEYVGTTIHLTCKNFSDIMKESLKIRLGDIVGKEFVNNAVFIYSASIDFVIYGYCSVPTYNIHNTSKQFLFVNRRYVKEKMFFGIVKAAYAGTIENGKNAIAYIYVDINPEFIDVNVSPSKTIVKFKDVTYIKSLLIESIKNTIKSPEVQKTSTNLPLNLINTINKRETRSLSPNVNKQHIKFDDTEYGDFILSANQAMIVNEENFFSKMYNKTDNFASDYTNSVNNTTVTTYTNTKDVSENSDLISEPKLGYAKAQYNNKWIISESKSGLVLIDQHAAHERITQEKLYNQYIEKNIAIDMLLNPEIVSLLLKDMDILLSFKNNLQNLGLIIDKFDDSNIIVRGYPKILGQNVNFKFLITNLLGDLKELGRPEFFLTKLRDVIAKFACHSSIRGGDKLSLNEMNELLRQIEITENSGQCPHGRPTYIIIRWSDIDKLFSRR